MNLKLSLSFQDNRFLLLPFFIIQLIVPVIAVFLGKQFLALISVSQKTINSPLVAIPITVLIIWHAYFTNCVASLFFKIHKFNLENNETNKV